VNTWSRNIRLPEPEEAAESEYLWGALALCTSLTVVIPLPWGFILVPAVSGLGLVYYEAHVGLPFRLVTRRLLTGVLTIAFVVLVTRELVLLSGTPVLFLTIGISVLIWLAWR